ncbi:MAG TPA: cellulose biosynthesis cyclic di-GMP-binding regulatory protein BcsB [Devosia sp.]|uniref:cellulose biosynthesis cyclic di-GMP-binding regulatory protein BcsB n=1 Tax=Devosia sp. TaxID=1871048 RepID=UPI002F93F8F1
MNKSRLLLAALLATAALPVLAQPVPFDMTPESDLRVAPPAPQTQSQSPAAPATPAPPPPPQRTERFLLPSGNLRLDGEESRRALVVYLTQAQADAPARLDLSYLNAVVVAPEISNLAIAVNGTEVTRRPIASSAAPTALNIDLPPGLLRAGPNTIQFSAHQRHRTDCTIGSTYELWTEIEGAAASLSFEGDLGEVQQLADLAAVGLDSEGRTTVRLITPLADDEAKQAAIDLAQNLALAMRVPNLQIVQATELSTEAAPGALDVVFGPASELQSTLPDLADQAQAGPIAAMVPGTGGINTLLVSGPDWSAVAQATDAILATSPVSPSRPRIDLPYAIPTVLGGQSLTLGELGVPTIEFNGRRYVARFQFELPPDFYANLYGEAELILDAAYSADVQPGSEIDIYTNGQIASATPLLRTDGGQLRDTVIRFPMTNLRPGRNEVEVSVNLDAASDAACSPGWTGDAPVRFVMSSSTQFRLPDYARASSLPDLQVFAGWGWPYTEDAEVPLVVGEGMDATLAATTMLARIATASGKPLPARLTPEAELQPGDNALVVMPLGQMSPPTFSRVRLAEGVATRAGTDENGVLDQFRTRGNQVSAVDSFINSALERVGLSLSDLRFMPQQDPAYTVAANSVAISQTVQPEGGVWTVLTGLDAPSMLSGLQRMAATEHWRQLRGRVSALSTSDTEVAAVSTVAPVLRQTQPFSLWNMRLVAANWFSGNILFFTAALASAAILLMLTTALVLSKVGRQK